MELVADDDAQLGGRGVEVGVDDPAVELVGPQELSFGRLQAILWLDWKLDLDQKRAGFVGLIERLADLAARADDAIAVWV